MCLSFPHPWYKSNGKLCTRKSRDLPILAHLGNQISSGIDGYKPLHILALHDNEGKSPAVSPESSVPLLPSVTNEVLQDSRGRALLLRTWSCSFLLKMNINIVTRQFLLWFPGFPIPWFVYVIGRFPRHSGYSPEDGCENASPGQRRQASALTSPTSDVPFSLGHFSVGDRIICVRWISLTLLHHSSKSSFAKYNFIFSVSYSIIIHPHPTHHGCRTHHTTSPG